MSVARRIEFLDGLRGVAVAMVVLYHCCLAFAPYGPRYDPTRSWLIARYGNMGVELFFLISGFVILMTLEKCRTFGEFFRRRWLRLFPAMLVAGAFTLALWSMLPAGWRPTFTMLDVLPGLTLIDDRWYSWALGTTVNSLDGAYWTLFVEMRFYVIFGVAWFALGERVAIAILLAMGLVYLVLLSAGMGMGVFRFTDLHFEPWFAAGALFYRWTRNRRRATLALAVASGLLAAWTYYPSVGPRLFSVVLVALFGFSLRVAALQALLSSRPLLWLGAISYPLYLLHTRILEASYRVVIPYVDHPLLLPIPGVLLALAAAHLTARYAEPWTRARIDHLLGWRRRVGAFDRRGQPEAP